jgi:GT2 family glycosyltransferase
MRKIYVIIITYYPSEVLEKVISVILANGKQIIKSELKVTIIDNTPEGSRRSIVSGKFRNVECIINKNNLGFAKAANLGITNALKKGATEILLLNQDVILEGNFLKPIIENKSEIVSPVIKFMRTGGIIYDFGGKIDWNWGRTSHYESGIPPSSRLRRVSKNQFRQIDYVSGCCMKIKREVFEKIGLFDERFYMYFEDVDFCVRAKKAGFKIEMEPKSYIFHDLKEGMNRSFNQQKYLLLSNTFFILKYLGIKFPLGLMYITGLLFKLIFNKII